MGFEPSEALKRNEQARAEAAQRARAEAAEPILASDLRDYIAGQVVASLLLTADKVTAFPPTIREIAEKAYQIADAMMEARKL